MRLTALLAALCAVLFASNADARPRHHKHHQQQSQQWSLFSLLEAPQAVSGQPRHVNRAKRHAHRRVPEGLARVMAEGAGRIVSHPAGCPSRAFCGCGASVERFGRSIRSLWLAANWLRFPRAEPAPGRAAVRRDGHHVVILREHVRGPIWIVYDANSGRHRTRIHPRSIAGYVIVDPSAGA